MPFTFQNPRAGNLRTAIHQAADPITALEGGAVFAFATADGIRGLASAIENFLEAGKPFLLIVGIDAITNPQALLLLADLCSTYPSLTAKIFYHDELTSTFHPKFTWFETASTLRLITGSGNLTRRGFGPASQTDPPGNWEAFSRQEFSPAERGAILATIDRWIAAETATGRLRNPDDPDVRRKAMANARVRPAPRERRPAEKGIATAALPTITNVPTSVMLKELSSNSARHGQADVGKKALAFLGFRSNEVTSVMLQSVALDNALGDVVTTKIFRNSSLNFRVELAALQSVPYAVGPNDERMILVVARFEAASYRYTIVPVGDPNYTPLSRRLGPIASGRRTMREPVFLADLISVWPGAPKELLPVTIPAALVEALD